MNIQEHIRFFNKVLALTTIYAKHKVDDLAYVELHSIDLFTDTVENKQYLTVSYSYTRLDNDVIPDFNLISLDYLDLDLKDAEHPILTKLHLLKLYKLLRIAIYDFKNFWS